MRNAFSYIQWKIAMARMQDANMAASEITEQRSLTQRAARKIAGYHLDRYFEIGYAFRDWAEAEGLIIKLGE
jgi:hypothetical protein